MFKLFGTISIVILFFLICFMPWAKFSDVEGMNLSLGLSAPSYDHLLGTDELGRDMLLRFSSAYRDCILPLWFFVGTAFLVGSGLSFVSIISSQRWVRWIGKMVGGSAFLFALIPLGVTVFSFSVYFQKNGLWAVIYSIFVVVFAKSYINIQQLYQRDYRQLYWDAHQAIGGSLISRVWRYGICQQWSRQLVYELIFYLKVSVIAEVSVSYLGFGTQEPNASIGNILASHFSESLRGPTHVVVVTWLALLLAVSVPDLIRSILDKTLENRTLLKVD